MPKRYSKYLKYIHFFGDLSILNLCYFLSYIAIFGKVNPPELVANLDLYIYYNLSWVALVIFLKPYRFSRITQTVSILRNHASIITIHLLLLTAFFVLNVEKIQEFSRNQILICYIMVMVGIFLWKFSFIFWLKLYRAKGFNLRNVVVVGYGELAEDLTKFFKQHPEFGFRLMGFFDNQAENPKVVGKLESIREYSLTHKVDQIYCCLPYLKYSQVDEIIKFADANLIKVKLIADLRGFSSKGLELEKYDHIPVINVTAIPLDITKNKIVKRTFDIGFSFLIMVLLLSWLLPILSILIKIDSKGPVFFLQKRTGKNNKDFWCLKLRTMKVNDDANYKQATKGDERITKLGHFLRKTSLDELPQFINVFLGDMSIVGPRPHMLTHTEKYSQVIDKFMHRHLIKPGITGLAQAKGYRGETKSLLLMKNRVKLDRFYVENWTMLLDLKIVVLTIMSMIKGNENAY